jgi:1,4-alpha-glucan branching enzyme
MAKGYLAIVLHAHLPFVRHPEHEEFLEENWLFEAITECYVPILLVLDNLAALGIDYRLTFSLSPTLASMLSDPLLQSRYLRRMENLIELAGNEIRRTASDPELNRLAVMYRDRFIQVRDMFVNRYRRDLVSAFRRLRDIGKLELTASAATHGYLPLLSFGEGAVRAQIRVGIDYYKENCGGVPGGFWLPECGYYPGVDELLTQSGIRFTVVETHGVTRANPRPVYGIYAPVLSPSGLAVFGRDPGSSRQVWSSEEGYPGDSDYREFYRDVGHDLDIDYIRPYIHPDGIRIDTGVKYHRITGKTDRKEVYNPKAARTKTDIHALDFIRGKQMEIDRLAPLMDRKPLIVAPYDAELFGHWWYEGPIWLDRVIRKLALEQESIRLVTLSEYLDEYPVNQIATPSTSSWGNKGYHETWLNSSNDWIYPELHRAQALMQELARRHANRSEGLLHRALNQASRELLLAQASDWAFMINAGSMADYATSRVKTHLRGFFDLKKQIDEAKIDEQRLAAIEDKDNIFPALDFRIFA